MRQNKKEEAKSESMGNAPSQPRIQETVDGASHLNRFGKINFLNSALRELKATVYDKKP